MAEMISWGPPVTRVRTAPSESQEVWAPLTLKKEERAQWREAFDFLCFLKLITLGHLNHNS